ncbi:MAG: hypothetical protein RLZZ126_571 [Pseudomonadota bacterium]|jgi:tRNA threonylcarbamoyladenosine biosynthesis protein TsaB
MNILALDTSTETLSLALQCDIGGQSQVLQFEGPGAAQSSASLIPGVERLLAQAGLRVADLDLIAFGQGPGSFTGLRTACAVAQGLAYPSGVPVLPVNTLLVVAEQSRRLQGRSAEADCTVLAVLDARMGEVYAAACHRRNGVWQLHGDVSLAQPQELDLPPGTHWLAGNAFASHGDTLPGAALPRVDCLPTAPAMLRLATSGWAAGQALRAAEALPLYVRDKVAKTTQERLLDKKHPLP